MTLDGLPGWLPAWCAEHLGDEPVGVLFEARQMSAVFGLRLAGGRDVVVKAREDDGRAASCVAAQARLAERGFPCARPLTPAVTLGVRPCTPRNTGPAAGCSGATLRRSPRAARRCSPG